MEQDWGDVEKASAFSNLWYNTYVPCVNESHATEGFNSVLLTTEKLQAMKGHLVPYLRMSLLGEIFLDPK